MDQKLPGIQIARAVAALSIVYFHSWTTLDRFPKDTAHPVVLLAGYGWLGVDLFFAISGYVICLIAVRPEFNPVSFLVRRCFRVYPLWLASLATFATLAMVWRGLTNSETFGYFLYSATLLPTEQFPFYDIGWSLQHEVTFYLLTAAVAPFFGLYGLAAVLAVSTLAFHTLEMPWFFSNFAMYHGEFLAGVLAFLVRPRIERLSGTAFLCLCVGTAMLWYVIAVAGGRYWLPIPLFFLVLGFATMKSSWSPIVEIGNASYSLYLLHPLVFLLAKSATIVAPPIWSQEPIRWIAITTAIAISSLSWRYFEKPMIALGRALDNSRDVVADNCELHDRTGIFQTQVAQAKAVGIEPNIVGDQPLPSKNMATD